MKRLLAVAVVAACSHAAPPPPAAPLHNEPPAEPVAQPPIAIEKAPTGGGGTVVSDGPPDAGADPKSLKAMIRTHIKDKANLERIQYCYEKQLLVTPSLAGTVTVTFFISDTGAVASSTATGMDPTLAQCCGDVIKTIQFDKPPGGGGVQVNYPFTFKAAGS